MWEHEPKRRHIYCLVRHHIDNGAKVWAAELQKALMGVLRNLIKLLVQPADIITDHGTFAEHTFFLMSNTKYTITQFSAHHFTPQSQRYGCRHLVRNGNKTCRFK